MRNVLAIMALSLGLILTGPAVAADAPPCPPTTYVSEAQVRLLQQVAALTIQNQSLAFGLDSAKFKLHRRWHRIAHQRREIRRLRAQLRAASNG